MASPAAHRGLAPAGLVFGHGSTPGSYNLYVVLNGGVNDFNMDGAVYRFPITSTGGTLSYNPTNTGVKIAEGMFQPTGMTIGIAPGDTDTLYVSDSLDDNIVKILNASTATTPSGPPSVYINGLRRAELTEIDHVGSRWQIVHRGRGRQFRVAHVPAGEHFRRYFNHSTLKPATQLSRPSRPRAGMAI